MCIRDSGYTTGASVLKAGVNTSISKLEHNNAAALITGEGTTLTLSLIHI